MLLYDRVMEALHRTTKRRLPQGEYEAQIAIALREASVYEISSVVPLFKDWARECDRPISKRAPGLSIWCEWSHIDEFENESTRWRIGTLITEVPTLDFLPLLDTAIAHQEERTRTLGSRHLIDQRDIASWRPKVIDTDIAYLVTAFKLVEETNHPLLIPRRNEVGISVPSNAFCFRQTGEFVGAAQLYTAPEGSSIFDLGVMMVLPATYHVDDPMHLYWPPFMAFSLLHCKNVITQENTPSEQTQRKVRKAGNPDRVTFKTIMLHVPETHKTASAPGEPSGVKMGFHLCRGHIKNLTHPRYKEPGPHWWPAHWRGDPEQGIIITDRKLEPQ